MAKTTQASGSASRPPARTKRRADIRRNLPRQGFDYKALLARPDVIRGTAICLVFVALASAMTIWSRQQVMVRDGQIMTETRLKRLDYQVENEQRTEDERVAARRNSRPVYALNNEYFGKLEGALLGLPLAVAGRTDLEGINESVQDQFQLTENGLAQLQDKAVDGKPSPAWSRVVDALVRVQLHQTVFIDPSQYQEFRLAGDRALLVEREGELPVPFTGAAQELQPESEEFAERMLELVNASGFPREIAPYVLARLLHEPQATLHFDAGETKLEQVRAVDAVPLAMDPHVAGDVLYGRGDRLSTQDYNDVVIESSFYRASLGTWESWTPRLGVIGLCLVMVLLIAVFVAHNYPRLGRNGLRIISAALLMSMMLAVSVTVTYRGPMFMYIAAIAPTLFVAVVMVLAYDQRLAAVIGAAQCALVAMALGQSVSWFVLLLAGCATMIAQLPEVRNRNTLIRAASVTAVVFGGGSILLGLYEVPIVPGAWGQILTNAGGAAAASFLVGFLVLGILPSIERLFDITTGMTLAELRDSRQQLLRQLQQKAPGTYNHSLQVANICEAATEAIGADSLLVYVGALYHDIGKLNKPEYFIENQASGHNKHDKLSPAMSLLVIIGHVKDGIELAREYGLPRSLIHFIESHHGTTLVEYFYHAAKEAAETDEKTQEVDEVVFRYPGPKPRTRETAILMLADAVESATRAMAEPNPSRIESLVREISRKRLTDGQFDQCPLTFRELGLIEDAIISRLCAIHHGRISYPTSKPAEPEEEGGGTRTATA